MSFEDAHFRLLRLRYRLTRPFRRLIRRLRYRRMPKGGWGKGWRVLVFRYGDGMREELHVLAPVDGGDFDWETLRLHVRGKPWPEHRREPGKKTGVTGWAGHHTYVVTSDAEPQRLAMGKLVPGEFGGGTDRGFVLIDVRDAGVQPAGTVQGSSTS